MKTNMSYNQETRTIDGIDYQLIFLPAMDIPVVADATLIEELIQSYAWKFEGAPENPEQMSVADMERCKLIMEQASGVLNSTIRNVGVETFMNGQQFFASVVGLNYSLEESSVSILAELISPLDQPEGVEPKAHVRMLGLTAKKVNPVFNPQQVQG